jgi:hypothetical protein
VGGRGWGRFAHIRSPFFARRYLANFHKDREEDVQFRDEKALVISTLEGLEAPVEAPVEEAGGGGVAA